MKKIFLILLAIIFKITVCFPQVNGTDDINIGLVTKISPDNQYLKIINCYPGSLADISGLRVGDRIYMIDDKKVSELANPISQMRNTSISFVKLTIGRFGKTDFFEVNVPQISITANLNNYITEGKLYASTTAANRFKTSEFDLELFNNDAKDMFKYKTYDFEFTSIKEPLQEKILFNKLETQLNELGMKRTLENPDLLIIIDFFCGKTEQYVPPQQIISTKIKNTYNWYWGVVPVPITKSTTEEGYTKVTYLTTLNLKFLDASEIEGSKTPPVVWSGFLSETTTYKTLLTERCSDFFRQMLYQFPEVWQQNSKPYYPFHYAYIGLVYNREDMRTIGDVIPGSPAEKLGIKKGDVILSLYGKPFSNRYNKYSKILEYQAEIKASGINYLIIFDQSYGGSVGTSSIAFNIKRNGNLMKFSIVPEDKVIYLLKENF